MRKVVYITGRCACGKTVRRRVRGIIDKTDFEPTCCKCGRLVEFTTIEVHSGPRLRWLK